MTRSRRIRAIVSAVESDSGGGALRISRIGTGRLGFIVSPCGAEEVAHGGSDRGLVIDDDDAFHDRLENGRRIVTSEPNPASLERLIFPPLASRISLVSARPSPLPRAPDATAPAPRKAKSNARARSSSLIPMPVSLTTTKAWGPAAPARMRTSPPCGVYLMAFSRTLRNARWSATGSARTASSGRSAMNSIRSRPPYDNRYAVASEPRISTRSAVTGAEGGAAAGGAVAAVSERVSGKSVEGLGSEGGPPASLSASSASRERLARYS